jgi:hypothetical protein
MRIEITFHADTADDEYAKLDGKRMTMEDVDNLHMNTAVDMFDGPDGKLPGETGSLTINAHGKRALWSE